MTPVLDHGTANAYNHALWLIEKANKRNEGSMPVHAIEGDDVRVDGRGINI